jgi:hypothetical protein
VLVAPGAAAWVGASRSFARKVDVANVRFGSIADISERIRDVRFAPESGHVQRRHRGLLSAISGHCPDDILHLDSGNG